MTIIVPSFKLENNIDLFFLISNIVLFITLYILLMIIYKEKIITKAKINKRNIFNTYDAKTIIFMLVAAGGGTLLISKITTSIFADVSIFICILLMLPYVINTEVKRIIQENVFEDVILYCQNMAILLKNTKSVYDSLNSVRHDLRTSLGDDVEQLQTAFQEGLEQTKLAMSKMEENYPYTCLKELNIIMIFMFNETSHINDSILLTFQEDLEKLSNLVRLNKEKRKSERIIYISLNAIAILGFWFFKSQIVIPFNEVENVVYKIVNTIYIYCVLFSLFLVNQYFSTHSTKE